MALKEFGVSNALTNKLYSVKLAVTAIQGTYIDKFSGESEDEVIQMMTEAQKRPGDQITCGLALNLEGDGVLGNDVLEGNEEAIDTADDALILNELGHATKIRAKGTISAQRVPYDMRELALKKLGKWWSERKDLWAANQLCGNTSDGGTPADRNTSLGDDIRKTGLQATVAPDTDHILIAGNQSNDQSLTSSDTFHVNLIDYCVERAKTLYPLIRPIMVGGQPFYVCFAHPHQITDLRTAATTSGSWYDIQARAMEGGEISGNPIFTGAVGVYNQTIIHEWGRVSQGVNSSNADLVANTRRAVFCGAQAAWVGYGQDYGPSRFKWVEELFDYNKQLGVSGTCVGGLKSSRFTIDGTAKDYGKIVISTYAAQHTDA